MSIKQIKEELIGLTADCQTINNQVSEELAKIKRDNKDCLHKITRNGQEQEVAERFLWDEIFNLGLDCEAGKLMEAKYPELWENVKKQEELTKKLTNLSIEKFGFDFRQMTLLNLIILIERITEGEKEEGGCEISSPMRLG